MAQLLLQTSWWLPCYGLIGAVLTLPWSANLIRRTGPRPAAYFNLLMTVLAFVHGALLFRLIATNEPQHLVFHWLQVADLDLTFSLEISLLTVGAMELVAGLSLSAQLFALGYMEKDWALARFFALMLLKSKIFASQISNALLNFYLRVHVLNSPKLNLNAVC